MPYLAISMHSVRGLNRRYLLHVFATQLLGLGACLITIFVHLTAYSAENTGRPNIVLILADDPGYADLGVHGCKDIPSPNIHSLAKNGVRCTRAYVTPGKAKAK